MEENKNVTVNQETKEATQEQPKQEAPQMQRGETPAPQVEKYTQVTMPVWVAKGLSFGKKFLKYAVPVGIAAGSVFLGIHLGRNDERRNSAGTIGDLQSRLDKANSDIALLEAKANSIPELPQIELPEVTTELPSLNLETGEF